MKKQLRIKSLINFRYYKNKDTEMKNNYYLPKKI